MSTKTTLWILFLTTAVLLAAGLLVLGGQSEPFITHWNAQGQPDGYSSRLVAIYLLPLMLLGTGLLVLSIPAIDPLRRNVAAFRPSLNVFVLYLAGFLGYLYILTLLYNRGVFFSLNQALMPAVALLLWAVAGLLARAKRNWFVGIRTPWTLSDDRVWEQTHRVGARGFRAVAGTTLLGVVFPSAAVPLLMIPLLLATFGILIYSYVVYRRVQSGG